jgi:hypothetical protein
MSLLTTAAQLFIQHIGTKGANVNITTVINALQTLLPTQAGDIDISALVSKFVGQTGSVNLASIATGLMSGQGGNIDIAKILSVLGQTQVSQFASDVGVDINTAATGLSKIIPELLSNGASTDLAAVAGSAAKNIFGKFL